MKRPIFVDIDGVLTDKGTQGGKPLEKRLAALRELIAKGTEVVVWSGGGTTYAREFCERHALVAVAIGKPDIVIDDNPMIRPLGRMKVLRPDEFFEVFS